MGEPGRAADRAKFHSWTPARQHIAQLLAYAEWRSPERRTRGAAWAAAMQQLAENDLEA